MYSRSWINPQWKNIGNYCSKNATEAEYEAEVVLVNFAGLFHWRI